MEITRVRLLVLSTLFAISALTVSVQSPLAGHRRTERWMEDVLPTKVDGFRMVVNRTNPRQSYAAAAQDYELLAPYGIVCRIFVASQKAFDTVVIASNALRSFHNPEVCLPANDWSVVESRPVSCMTRRYGQVPVCLLRLRTPSGERWAAFTYKSGPKFFSSQFGFSCDWAWQELRGDHDREGSSFRIIQVKGVPSSRDLLAFTAAYLDAAGGMSGGVL